ncbi:damage-control phosphatase ARMT1-like isoform X2 [Uloborus diversus]|nr:damage-control phosphatase ARMT1-like isoform X2 [Uloborus diversus]
MVTNKLIKPLSCISEDTESWNNYLKKQEETCDYAPAWFDSPWLYVECYLYRRMKEAFELSSVLKDYDYFRKQKEEAFLQSMDAVVLLCSELNQTVSSIQKSNENELYNYFRHYLEISLWGNKWDLSISAGKESVQQPNPLNQLKEWRRDILVNHTETVWQILQEAKSTTKEVQIDFILDNAAFELFCDFCFLHFLDSCGIVNKVRLHVKRMPWFVSDTLYSDIKWFLEILSQSSQENLAKFGKEWTNKFFTKQWTIENNTFWTLPHDYSEMLDEDSKLYQSLSKSDLLIFKGDLNYRKLTGDRQWSETTPFLTALNGFFPTSLVSLRAVKADVIVGLEPGTSDNLSKLCEDWKFTGKYAVIQCHKCTN